MDNRNINEEYNVAYDRDATSTNKVSNKIENKKESTPTTSTNWDPLQWGKNALKGVDLTNLIKTPKVDQNVSTQERKAEIDAKINRGGYTPPSIYRNIDMSQVEENEKKAEQTKADAEAEAKEAEEAKHRKAEKMWSAIGDGISAIVDMATVGAGADSMYNPADSLHSKVKSKWDEIKANKAAVAAANRKAQMDLLLADLGYQHASVENEKNRQSKWNEFWTKLQETNRHNQEMEEIARDRAESYETNAQANKTRASKYKGGGSSGGGGGSSKHEFLGKSYPSANARNQAILDKANELGVPTHDAEKRPRRYADVEYDIRQKIKNKI